MDIITERERVINNLIVRALEINDAEERHSAPMHYWEYLQEALNEYKKVNK